MKMPNNKDQDFYKEIDLIQGCINRMAHNSFLVKGWAITIITAVITIVATKQELPPYSLNVTGIVSFLVVIAFWYLDSFFLYMEKLYREMYQFVIKTREDESTQEVKQIGRISFDLNPYKFKGLLKNQGFAGQWNVVWSKTLWPFYLILVIASLVASIFNIINVICQ